MICCCDSCGRMITDQEIIWIFEKCSGLYLKRCKYYGSGSISEADECWICGGPARDTYCEECRSKYQSGMNAMSQGMNCSIEQLEEMIEFMAMEREIECRMNREK